MKLRIRANSIRLRLTKSEVENIKETGLIEEKTVFPNNQIFVYSLFSAEINQPQAEFADGNLKISVPSKIIENWANNEEVGIYGKVENLVIAVEKDFNCLVTRVGDEDKDTFPHPQEGSVNC